MNKKQQNIGLDHAIEDFDEGQEYEMNLKDVNVLENEDEFHDHTNTTSLLENAQL